MRHLPTALTILRLLLAPVIAWCVFSSEMRTAFVIGWIAGITDFLDGYLARRFHWQSRTGGWLDAVSDKILLSAAYLALALTLRIPLWFAILVFGRDLLILVIAAAGLLFTSIRDFPPSLPGKLSTVLQLLAAGAVMYEFKPAINPMIYASAGLTAASGLHYFYLGLSKLREVHSKPGLNPIDETPRCM